MSSLRSIAADRSRPGPGILVQSRYQVRPTALRQVDLALRDPAPRLHERMKEHEDVGGTTVEESVVRVPHVRAKFSQLAVDLAGTRETQERSEFCQSIDVG